VLLALASVRPYYSQTSGPQICTPYALISQRWLRRTTPPVLGRGIRPKEMRDARILTLNKNKGDGSECNNYRGISLLSITGELFARVVLTRNWLRASIQSPNVASGPGPKDPPLTWYSSYTNSSRNAENSKGLIHGLWLPHQGFWPRQQRWVIPDPTEDRVPSEASQHHQVFPWEYARDGAVRSQSIRQLQHTK